MFYDQRKALSQRVKACIRSLTLKKRTPKEIERYIRRAFGKNYAKNV